MSWLSVCGENRSDLEQQLEEAVAVSFKQHDFNDRSLTYLSSLDRSISIPVDSVFNNEQLLQKLRELCIYWDLSPNSIEIKSHRKFIGPVTVCLKKMLFSILKVLLKPSFEKQSKFNAKVIEIFAEMSTKKNA